MNSAARWWNRVEQALRTSRELHSPWRRARELSSYLSSSTTHDCRAAPERDDGATAFASTNSLVVPRLPFGGQDPSLRLQELAVSWSAPRRRCRPLPFHPAASSVEKCRARLRPRRARLASSHVTRPGRPSRLRWPAQFLALLVTERVVEIVGAPAPSGASRRAQVPGEGAGPPAARGEGRYRQNASAPHRRPCKPA